MKSYTLFVSIFLVFAVLSFALADDRSYKQILSETGDKISKSTGEAYEKAKNAAKDAASSARESFNKGLDKLNENIKPKDTLDKIKKLIPGMN